MSSLSSRSKESAVLFDIQTLGSGFEEVAVDFVRGETTDFVSRWFKSSRGDADLSIWTDGEKRIVKFQLSVYGQVVEWTPIHGTRTGLIIELESAPGTDLESETIEFDSKVDSGSLGQAMTLLNLMTVLSEQERSTLIFNLRESPKLHKRARERAIRAWAPKSSEFVSNERPTFWKRLSHWIFKSK